MSISPARAIYQNKDFLKSLKPRIDSFIKLSGRVHDLPYHQFFQLAAIAYEMKPDLIVELGRAYGNSTFVFTEVAGYINAKVISLCDNNFWATITLPKIRELVNDEWLKRLDARFVNNFLEVEMKTEILPAKKVLVFWDAHGFQTAEYVLGYLLPMMKGKECMVVMHDITDMRYQYVDDSYRQQRIWRPDSANEGLSMVRVGNFSSFNEQLIAAFDFCSRNKMELRSADQSFLTELSEIEVQELWDCLNDGFNTEAHWAYFNLDKPNFWKLHFPAFDRRAAVEENKFKRDYLKGVRDKQDEFMIRSERVRRIAIYLQQLADRFGLEKK
ncbi:MAG: hypothetical protein JWO06_2507 [Bacteroidota bacterium]|nr:hypothetical protein [Bacteroidota bacterium]